MQLIVTLSVISSSPEKKYMNTGFKKKKDLTGCLPYLVHTGLHSDFCFVYINKGCCYRTSVVFFFKSRKVQGEWNGTWQEEKGSVSVKVFEFYLGRSRFFSLPFSRCSNLMTFIQTRIFTRPTFLSLLQITHLETLEVWLVKSADCSHIKLKLKETQFCVQLCALKR